MRKMIGMMLAVGLMGGVAFADVEATVPSVVEATAEVSVSAFHKYAVEPVRWVHRFTWGVLAVAYRIGKAPVDAGFRLIGSTIGTEPNEPLWE